MNDASDFDALLHDAVSGDSEALETLLLQNFERLVSHLSGRIPDDVRSALSAEDVVQEALIVAFQRIGDLEPRGPEAFFGWLARIGENRLMDAVKALRAAKRGGEWGKVGDPDLAGDDLIPLLETLHEHSHTPSRSAAAHEAATAVIAALEGLEPDYRDVLRWRYIENRPMAECAARLGRSEGAAHMLHGRALAALRARIGGHSRYLTGTA